jgi:hypothetical protein
MGAAWSGYSSSWTHRLQQCELALATLAHSPIRSSTDRVSGLAGAIQGSEILTSGKGVSVIGAEHPQPVGKQLLERRDSSGDISRLPSPESHHVAGAQGVWVIGAEHPQPVGKQLLERRDSSGDISRLPSPESQDAAAGQRVCVIGAEHPQLVGKQQLELRYGSGYIARLPAPETQKTAGA